MAKSPAYPHKSYTSTEARQRFPDHVQEVYGNKGIIGVTRYERMLGAIVSPEAVRLLAGEKIDPEMELRIRNAARNLIEE